MLHGVVDRGTVSILETMLHSAQDEYGEKRRAFFRRDIEKLLGCLSSYQGSKSCLGSDKYTDGIRQ